MTSPKFTEDEIGLLLTKALERRSVSKEDIVAISEMQKALREGNKNFGSGKNELRRVGHSFSQTFNLLQQKKSGCLQKLSGQQC